MDLGIAGRKAIVCASSRGLGFACAKALAEAGCEVVINGRNEAQLAAAAAALQEDRRQGDPGCRRRRLARRPESPVRRLSRAGHPGQQQCRPAVSRFPRARPAEDARRRHRQYDRGHRAHSESDRSDGRQEIRPHRQHHLRLGQNADRRASTCRPARAPASPPSSPASRARIAASNVTINFVLPGIFDTDRLRSNMEIDGEEEEHQRRGRRAERMASVPAKRFGQPDELGAACAFLCSAQAGYITGQNLLIDGGVFPGAF